MKIGLAEWGMRDLPVIEHYKAANKMGIKQIELGIGGTYPGRLSKGIDDKMIKTLKLYSKEFDVSTPFMCFVNDFTQEDRGVIRTKIDDIINELSACNDLGVTHIRLFTGFSSPQEVVGDRWKCLIESLTEIAKACKTYDIQISLETHGRLEASGDGLLHFPTTSTDKKCLARLIHELPENVGINFDPGNLKPVQDEDVCSFIDIVDERINYCHLKDWQQLDNGSWLAVAIGDVSDTTIDWVKLLAKLSFKGTYLIEYEPSEDVVDGFERSVEYLSNIVELEY